MQCIESRGGWESMFSMVLLNIFINYQGKDVNNTFIKLVKEARDVFLSTGWGQRTIRKELTCSGTE